MLTYIAVVVIIVIAFPLFNVHMLSLYWKHMDRRAAKQPLQVDWKNEFKKK